MLPISFLYGDRPAAELIKIWPCERSSWQLDDVCTEHTMTCADPETGLTVRLTAIGYADFPAVEWVVHLKNAGDGDTPIIADGDFYPLLTFSLATDVWAAWQFDRPDLGEGMVMAFRRHESPFSLWEAKLQGLDPESDYDLLSWDDQSTWRMTGKQLLEEGFVVIIVDKPGSALFTYQRVS